MVLLVRKNKVRLYIWASGCWDCYRVAGCWVEEREGGFGDFSYGNIESRKTMRIFNKCLGDIKNIKIGLVAQSWETSQDDSKEELPKRTWGEVYVNVVFMENVANALEKDVAGDCICGAKYKIMGWVFLPGSTCRAYRSGYMMVIVSLGTKST